MKFGIFDHMDRASGDLGRQFDQRLKLIELYEKSGFYAYHIAEHHATPLGMATAARNTLGEGAMPSGVAWCSAT